MTSRRLTGVAGGEAGRDADDALLSAASGQAAAVATRGDEAVRGVRARMTRAALPAMLTHCSNRMASYLKKPRR